MNITRYSLLFFFTLLVIQPLYSMDNKVHFTAFPNFTPPNSIRYYDNNGIMSLDQLVRDPSSAWHHGSHNMFMDLNHGKSQKTTNIFPLIKWISKPKYSYEMAYNTQRQDIVNQNPMDINQLLINDWQEVQNTLDSQTFVQRDTEKFLTDLKIAEDFKKNAEEVVTSAGQILIYNASNICKSILAGKIADAYKAIKNFNIPKHLPFEITMESAKFLNRIINEVYYTTDDCSLYGAFKHRHDINFQNIATIYHDFISALREPVILWDHLEPIQVLDDNTYSKFVYKFSVDFPVFKEVIENQSWASIIKTWYTKNITEGMVSDALQHAIDSHPFNHFLNEVFTLCDQGNWTEAKNKIARKPMLGHHYPEAIAYVHNGLKLAQSQAAQQATSSSQPTIPPIAQESVIQTSADVKISNQSIMTSSTQPQTDSLSTAAQEFMDACGIERAKADITDAGQKEFFNTVDIITNDVVEAYENGYTSSTTAVGKTIVAEVAKKAYANNDHDKAKQLLSAVQSDFWAEEEAEAKAAQFYIDMTKHAAHRIVRNTSNPKQFIKEQATGLKNLVSFVAKEILLGCAFQEERDPQLMQALLEKLNEEHNKLADNINQAAQAIGNMTQTEFEKFCGEIVGDIISGKFLYSGLGKTIQYGRTAIKVGNTPKPANVFAAAKKIPINIPQLNKPAPIDFRFNPATNAYEIAPELPALTQTAKTAASVVPPGNQSLPHAPLQKPKLLPTSSVPSSYKVSGTAKLAGAVKATSAIPTAPAKAIESKALATSSAETIPSKQNSILKVPSELVKATGAIEQTKVYQGVVTSIMTEELAKKIWAQSEECQILIKRVEELIKSTPNLKPKSYDHLGTIETMKLDELVEKIYAQIRATENDILQIHAHTQIPIDTLKKIKDHIFYQEHILWDGIKRFDGNMQMADAWQRLVKGDFIQADLMLFKHELAESLIMQGTKVDYITAHAIVNKYFNWDELTRG